MVFGKAKRFTVGQKGTPAGAGSLVPPFYALDLTSEITKRSVFLKLYLIHSKRDRSITSKDSFLSAQVLSLFEVKIFFDLNYEFT